jgi:hypothetical protein
MAVNVRFRAMERFSNFLDEAPAQLAERGYHKLVYYHKVEKGGHYAAWKRPKLFSEEVRASFPSLSNNLWTLVHACVRQVSTIGE